MPNEFDTWMGWLNEQPELLTLTATFALIVAAWLSNWIVKRILVRAIYRVVGATTLGRHGQIKESGIIKRLSHIVPALVLGWYLARDRIRAVAAQHGLDRGGLDLR